MRRHVSLSLFALCLSAWLVTAGFAQVPARDYSRWEKEISALEEAARTNPPPKNALLFTGSSTIRLWKTMAEDLPKYKVINHGFGGSQIVDSTYFAERIIFPFKPKMILFRAGGNDINAGKSAEQVFTDFKEFVAKVHGKLPRTTIVFISWNPTVARWKKVAEERKLNALVKALCAGQKRVKYLDNETISLGADGQPRPELFVADKLHFNAEGYKLFSASVRDFLAKQ